MASAVPAGDPTPDLVPMASAGVRREAFGRSWPGVPEPHSRRHRGASIPLQDRQDRRSGGCDPHRRSLVDDRARWWHSRLLRGALLSVAAAAEGDHSTTGNRRWPVAGVVIRGITSGHHRRRPPSQERLLRSLCGPLGCRTAASAPQRQAVRQW